MNIMNFIRQNTCGAIITIMWLQLTHAYPYAHMYVHTHTVCVHVCIWICMLMPVVCMCVRICEMEKKNSTAFLQLLV